jgi:hypothetical protein
MFRSRGVHESPTRIPESVEKRFRWLTGRRVLRRSEEEEVVVKDAIAIAKKKCKERELLKLAYWKINRPT